MSLKTACVKEPERVVTEQKSGTEEAEIDVEVEPPQEEAREVEIDDDFQYDMLEPECVLLPVEVTHANAIPSLAPRSHDTGEDTVPQQKDPSRDPVEISISTYVCGNCGKTFLQEHSLNTHFKLCQQLKKSDSNNSNFSHTSKNVYFCDICKKDIPKMSNFRVHQQIHSSERPYACEICHKGFKQVGTLKVHMRTHTGEKPYSCEECDKQFSQMSTLIKHRFQHTGEQPYTCDVCQRKFTYLINLKTHKRTHTGEKPHSCDKCNKRYATVRELKIHALIHTGEKPHVCEICNCGFRQLSTLKKHIQLHTPERYSCVICNKEFALLSYLKRHQRYSHGGITIC